MKVSAIISYPIYIEVDVDENISEEELDDLLLNKAENIFDVSSIKPVIADKIIEE